ncbi:uncharacterized protein N7477_002669 [Penicillium maclennaniae]|uniref:uncharacterized protein n=1 Tax=Penicillium maclennaniae TaxID=1343394 RepID=UPI002541A585|nr:uncharacterized protein N7477_002669 [Penicillium maclennaniae]KAJ5677036.1 hypothetical protein N7477_002669 [Penicillium maclennaniae]
MVLGMSSKRAYNWFISLVAAACMVLYGYDASVFNSVQGSDNWMAYFNNPSAATIGSINTAYTVGAIFGGFFVGGPVADYLGRKVGMAIGCVLVIGATFMQTFAPRHSLACFLVGRCIIGIGQGVALTAGPVYIGELSPPEIRGKIMTFWQMFYSVGSFICFWINYACTKNVEKLGEWDWKLVVIFQLLVPVLILALLPTMPGSPRWFIKRGNNIEKARSALRRVRDSEEEVEDEILQIHKSLRKRMLLALVINAGQQLTGQGSLNSYSTKIYKKVFTSDSQIALINALNATFGILFTLNAVWIIDRFGRKFLLIVGGIGMGICMIIVAAVETETPNLANGAKSESVGISIVFLLFLFIFFYKPSWGATVWIWTSEVFSMNVRAQAVGMASQTRLCTISQTLEQRKTDQLPENVANTIFQQFFPIFLDNDGFYAFYMFAGINFLLALFVFFFIPETKQVPLEEIDALFGGANHVVQGEQVLAQQKGVEAAHETHEKPGSVTIENVETRSEFR